jgi:hypothetical protein
MHYGSVSERKSSELDRHCRMWHILNLIYDNALTLSSIFLMWKIHAVIILYSTYSVLWNRSSRQSSYNSRIFYLYNYNLSFLKLARFVIKSATNVWMMASWWFSPIYFGPLVHFPLTTFIYFSIFRAFPSFDCVDLMEYIY